MIWCMQIPYRKPGPFSQIKLDPLVTKGKFSELKNKVERLKNSRPQAAADVARLADLGDFSENAAYQHAKGRLRGINYNILKLENQLNNAVIIKPEEQTETVQLGHTVTIAAGNNKKKYQILGSAETNPTKGIISHHSPIGVALLGHKVGEIITIQLTNKKVEYKITKIE